ncbi:unnamed protein product [Calypogeia fissa]
MASKRDDLTSLSMQPPDFNNESVLEMTSKRAEFTSHPVQPHNSNNNSIPESILQQQGQKDTSEYAILRNLPYMKERASSILTRLRAVDRKILVELRDNPDRKVELSLQLAAEINVQNDAIWFFFLLLDHLVNLVLSL